MTYQLHCNSVAVVIATCGRPELLRTRALAAVREQSLRPKLVAVVDDSAVEERDQVRAVVEGFNLPGATVLYVPNTRTPGASGAWNTGLDAVFARTEAPRDVFVAVLDDDDSWAPNYLETCHAAAVADDLDMVACGLRRNESGQTEPIVGEAPVSLRVDDFLTGNPGIQGSNLFMRLSVFLEAGCFDEALRSSTDRDLCIRIAELGTVRYRAIGHPLVDHYADSDRARLTTRGSPAKLEGLTAFWRKYVGRMSAAQREAFTERAVDLFDWQPPSDDVAVGDPAPEEKKALVLGLLVSPPSAPTLLETVRALASCRDDSVVGLDVVLVKAGEVDSESIPVDACVRTLRDAGAGCFVNCVESVLDQLGSRWPSDATSRDLLAFCCEQVASERTGSEAWIVPELAVVGEPPADMSATNLLAWLRAERVSEGICSSVAVQESGDRALAGWISAERVATARHRINVRYPTTTLRLLGCGSEGVVFTDGSLVYKCIDYWKTRLPLPQLEFLKRQVGCWSDLPGLYPLTSVVQDGPWALMTYPYEPGVPFEGGNEAGVVSLLQSCRDAGIVCNNIHPKNLIVTASGVRLIDYGSDIRPWNALGFEHMARRAFLAVHHAEHPQLSELMRHALRSADLPELAGYEAFRDLLGDDSPRRTIDSTWSADLVSAPLAAPYSLYVGLISSDVKMLRPLLGDLRRISELPCLAAVSVVVLANGGDSRALRAAVEEARAAGLVVAIVDEGQQRAHAAEGAFGRTAGSRPAGMVGIAQARTMLQRYLGALMVGDDEAIAWVLDDDMRVDARAGHYLPWLPVLRDRGTDVLIGAYEGSSPNPPLNGLRVALVDLVHNMHWLRGLDGGRPLPRRSDENRKLRASQPDYYYDLSRKHTNHLEFPHWIEPCFPGETVREAYGRLLHGAQSLLTGGTLTRPLVVEMANDPLATARDSVNRGGCTFVLNRNALTQTPNSIPRIGAYEARRSDMVWAIVNRYYRRMTIKAVAFPVVHVGRVAARPDLNVQKVRAEIVGSSLYGGLTDFLRQHAEHDLRFSLEEKERIAELADEHLARRWSLLEQSFHRISGLRETLRSLRRADELHDLVDYLDAWFTPESFAHVRAGIDKHDRASIEDFLTSLRTNAEDYAQSSVSVAFILEQFGRTRATDAGGHDETR